MSIWVDRSFLAWSNLHYKFSPTVRVPDCHERETSELISRGYARAFMLVISAGLLVVWEASGWAL